MGGWVDINTSTDACTHSKEGVDDMVSKVDMHTHTDTCTHSTQSVGPEKRYLAYACGATQGHPIYKYYAKGMQQMWGSQVDMLTCSDACTHF